MEPAACLFLQAAIWNGSDIEPTSTVPLFLVRYMYITNNDNNDIYTLRCMSSVCWNATWYLRDAFDLAKKNGFFIFYDERADKLFKSNLSFFLM